MQWKLRSRNRPIIWEQGTGCLKNDMNCYIDKYYRNILYNIKHLLSIKIIFADCLNFRLRIIIARLATVSILAENCSIIFCLFNSLSSIKLCNQPIFRREELNRIIKECTLIYDPTVVQRCFFGKIVRVASAQIERFLFAKNL